MTETVQPTTPAAPATTPFKSFADMVDYPTMYAELAQRGIVLTDAEKQRCEAICGDRLRNHDGGQVIGNSFGATIQGLVYTLFAFLRNIFGGGGLGDLGSMASNLSSTMATTGEQGKLRQLQLAEAETYDRLKKEGGNLAAAAEYITGVKPCNDNSPGQILQASIAAQVGHSIKLPFDTNTDLNGPTNVPGKPATQPLTALG